MIVVPVPARASVWDLADWVELRAVVAGDGSASRGDLESAVRGSPAFGRDSTNDRDAFIAAVFSEITDREAQAGLGYPFVLSGSQLQTKPTAWRTASAYLICLCLSWFGESRATKVDASPARLFEALSTEAAASFIGGSAVRFGSPRKELPSSFRRAVDELCQTHLGGEGVGFSSRETLHWTKDGGLDVVAWRDPGDNRTGRVIMFGACASGSNWPTKLGQLNADVWLTRFVERRPVGLPLKAFFVPFRLEGEPRWTSLSWEAGILFDRCRIARWAPRLKSSVHGNGVAWARAIMAQELRTI